MPEKIIETIDKTTRRPRLKKKDVLFVIKKVVSQANIPKKSVRHQKMS